MKKISISLFALALFFSSSAFNSLPGDDTSSTPFYNASNAKSVKEERVAQPVSKAFKTKYANARDVSWKETAGLYFVDFQVNEKSLKAAYAADGEMIAVSRIISADLLPLAVVETLNDRFSDYKMPGTVTEIVMHGATNYYLFVQGTTRNLQLKCSPDGNITVEKKFKKKILVGSVL